MKRAGVYVIRGTKGTRVGQSTNVYRRIPEVLKQRRKCVGQPRRIEFYPAQGVANRRRLEKCIIQKVHPSCNIRND
jgi:hypothetical protein